MLIHLKRNEKLYVNGAVIRLDRRGTVELMNDADFLLENHIMQPEQATSPLRQIYFLVQLMLMDPINAHLTIELFKVNMAQIKILNRDKDYEQVMSRIEERVTTGHYFEAMKIIRNCYTLEEKASAKSAMAHARQVEAA